MLRQVFTVGDNEAGHALFSHLHGEVVGVEVLAFESEKDGILFDLAAVGGYLISLDVVLVYGFYLGCLWVGPFDKLRDHWVLIKEAA